MGFRATYEIVAEPTGYNNDGEDDGWPVEYDRVKKMLFLILCPTIVDFMYFWR